MDRIEGVLNMLDDIFDTKRKRHLAGGILMSVSMLFGGLALTIITLKEEKNEQTYLE